MNYFIEGLQGSGKSTLLGRLSELHPGYTVLREIGNMTFSEGDRKVVCCTKIQTDADLAGL